MKNPIQGIFLWTILSFTFGCYYDNELQFCAKIDEQYPNCPFDVYWVCEECHIPYHHQNYDNCCLNNLHQLVCYEICDYSVRCNNCYDSNCPMCDPKSP
ncbi:UNVERIFIED_CONTAM: hypothetical protein RMT77_019390 [Armadillidium vulgare]